MSAALRSNHRASILHVILTLRTDDTGAAMIELVQCPCQGCTVICSWSVLAQASHAVLHQP